MIYDGLEEGPIKNLLRKFSYKPDWDFTVREMGLVISIIALDTDDISKTIRVNFLYSLPRFVTVNFPWDRWLLDKIMDVERHEAQEFFKIDGVKVFDPHG